ncbi:MAG: GUN4 domain-containing protein [Cylindrospermopsis raciborskii KL1]|uniref:GUN4 domain-containing protein n=2 Tax=Cylindrospermopsis raciborskii TaxID=77022 RepID=UPI001A32B749|nr:GUN4 domain-containing protein [Cylindrospermopsis raciborskii]MBG0744966.1 GUN4 domain-containing protein [Cylindrospermopsis raciborskii KL1]
MKLKKLTKPLLIGLLVLIIIITQPLLTVALTSTQINDIAEKITVRIGGANNGSGVIINKISNTYTVLSNAHVFKNKGQYQVYTYDGTNYSIINIQKAPNNLDLALFEFTSNTEYPVAETGDSDKVKRGNQVFVSGYPQGKTDMNFLDSIITRVDRQLKKGYTLVYRIGAYPGMSGGPVLDEQGKLIGIHGESQDIYGGAGLEPTPINREEYGIPIKTYQTWASQVIDSRYARLETLLKAQDFRAADEETGKVMLAVAKRENQGWLRIEDAEKFPCKELRSIDQLWLKYSRGKFGISVQQQIYQSLGGTKEFNWDTWRSMGVRVGWRDGGGRWLAYSDLNFSQTAPSGHLPTLARWVFWYELGVGWSDFPPVQTCRV